MAESRRTSEAKRLRPFMAMTAFGVAVETTDQDIEALLLALAAHKTSADHDGRYSLLGHLHDDRYSLLGHLHDDRYYTETESDARYAVIGHLHDDRYSLLGHLHDDRYYTETETDTLLGYKADKTITLTAGNGLTGGGTLAADRIFNVGAGAGISVAADSVAVDTTVSFTWSGVHTFNNTVFINGAFGLGRDQLVLNNDGTDVDVELQFYRNTGGAFSIFWNGVIAWTTKPFRPSELIINRISDTAPVTTFPGMVWVHPNG